MIKKSKPPKIDLLVVLLRKVEVLEMFQRKPNTMVLVGVEHEEQFFSTFGFSKVCHPDTWDEHEGVERATRNALIYLIQHYHLRPSLR